MDRPPMPDVDVGSIVWLWRDLPYVVLVSDPVAMIALKVNVQHILSGKGVNDYPSVQAHLDVLCADGVTFTSVAALTDVRVLTVQPGYLEVEVLSGPHAGLTGWVERAFVTLKLTQ